jgi:hypothetical protein
MFARVRGLLKRFGRGATLPMEERFTDVYEHGMWRSKESVSGLGSERASGQVAHAVDLLHRFTGELGLRSIADVPCGDFNWMPVFLEQHPEVSYVGYDVVPQLIEGNRRRYPGRRFELLDITRQVPKRADLLFSKDMVNHLFERDVWAALKNMVASKSTYLMITTNRGSENVDLTPGHAAASRLLDLEAAPYSMPAPLYGDHYMLLWPREAVAQRLSEVGG